MNLHARRGRARSVRAVRALPAALPDVSGHRRGVASPRGRIASMRQVQWADAPVDDAFTGYMDACVQCRGCETGLPAGCAVRAADGGHARRARTRADGRTNRGGAAPATGRSRITDSCSPVRACWASRTHTAAASPSVPRLGLPDACRCDSRSWRRAARDVVAVHRLRDGRLAARRARGGEAGDRGGWRRVALPRGARGGLLRRARSSRRAVGQAAGWRLR